MLLVCVDLAPTRAASAHAWRSEVSYPVGAARAPRRGSVDAPFLEPLHERHQRSMAPLLLVARNACMEVLRADACAPLCIARSRSCTIPTRLLP